VNAAVCADRESGWVARFGAATHAGNYRETNEDYFLLDRTYPFALVLDGMGGQRAGELASRTAAEVVRDALGRGLKAGEEPRTLIERAFRHGHDQVLAVHDLDRDFKNCGTTVVLALLHRECVYVSWLGDSPAFLATDAGIEKLTWDHDSRALFMRRMGMTEDEAHSFFWRLVLVYYLGGAWPEGEDRLEIRTHVPSPGDRIILATDGVSKVLTNEELLAVCRDNADPQSCADRLVALALERGSRDNCTCVVMTFDWVGDDPPEPPRPPAPRRWWQFWR
jgi:protein phosphatase